MKLSSLKIDKKAEVDGIWFDYGCSPDNDKIIRFKIARLNNPEQRRASLDIDNEDLNPDDRTRFIVANFILKDWENILDDDGKVIKYNPELGLVLLNESPEMADFIANKAMSIDNFRTSHLEKQAKN